MPGELLDEENMMRLCPDADDLWLKFIQLATSTPVVASTTHQRLEEVEGSQGQRLTNYNKHHGGNDIQLAQSREFVEGILRKTLEEACLLADAVQQQNHGGQR